MLQRRQRRSRRRVPFFSWSRLLPVAEKQRHRSHQREASGVIVVTPSFAGPISPAHLVVVEELVAAVVVAAVPGKLRLLQLPNPRRRSVLPEAGVVAQAAAATALASPIPRSSFEPSSR